MEKSCKIFGDGTNMADWQENFSSRDLGEDETVLAIRLAEALRTDEVETFLEIYDSIPSTTETKRVSILITTLLFLFLKSSARLEKLKFMRTRLSCFFLRIRVFALWKKKETVHSLQKMVLSFGEFAFVTRLPCEQPEQIFLALCFCRKMLSDRNFWFGDEILQLIRWNPFCWPVARWQNLCNFGHVTIFRVDIMQSLKYLLSIHVPQFRNVDAKVTQGLVRKTNKFDILYRKRSIVAS